MDNYFLSVQQSQSRRQGISLSVVSFHSFRCGLQHLQHDLNTEANRTVRIICLCICITYSSSRHVTCSLFNSANSNIKLTSWSVLRWGSDVSPLTQTVWCQQEYYEQTWEFRAHDLGIKPWLPEVCEFAVRFMPVMPSVHKKNILPGILSWMFIKTGWRVLWLPKRENE